MDEKNLKRIIKEAFVTQFNLFDEPTVSKVRKPRRKMSDQEKEERKEQRKIKKKIEADKKFEEYWGKRGVFQKEMYPEEEVETETVIGEESDSGINIKPENKGKFTATMKRTGKSVSELEKSKNPLTRKRANFAKMAKRGWKPLKKSE